MENGGVGYGSSDIVGLDHQPSISLDTGVEAQLQPVISNGRIVQVIVLNSGSRYFSTPDLDITGAGVGAVLTPVMSGGSITAVNVIEQGAGYDQESTVINVIPAGSTEVLPEFKVPNLNHGQ